VERRGSADRRRRGTRLWGRTGLSTGEGGGLDCGEERDRQQTKEWVFNVGEERDRQKTKDKREGLDCGGGEGLVREGEGLDCGEEKDRQQTKERD